MIKIQINNRKFEVPENWNGLKLREQLATYALICRDDHLVDFENVQIVPATLIGITCLLLKIDRKFVENWEKESIDGHEEKDGRAVFLSELQQVVTAATSFLFEIRTEADESISHLLRYELTKCPYPEIMPKKGIRLFGPADGLSNFSLYELAIAFTHFEKFAKSQHRGDALRLLSVIYRPTKPENAHNKRTGFEGDRRQPLMKSESMIDSRIPLLKNLPNNVIGLTLFWFASCRQQILRSYPTIFMTNETSLAGEMVGNNYGWANVIMALATDITKLNEVGMTSATNALVYLSWLEDQRKVREMAKK